MIFLRYPPKRRPITHHWEGIKLFAKINLREALKAIAQLTRWRQHVPFVVPLTILGAMIAIQQHDLSPDWRLGTIVIANILGMSCAFMLNDIEDAEDDALHPEKRLNNVISSGALSQQSGWMVFRASSAIALVLYALGGVWTALWGCLGLAVAYMYSAKPFRLKARPIVDVISHSLGAGSLQVVIGYYAYDNNPGTGWHIVLAMTLGSVYGQFYNQLDDYDVDKQAGLRNTTLLIGKPAATFLMYLAITSAALCIVIAMLQGIFPQWLGTVIVVSGIACALFVWKNDMRGNQVGFFEAFQIPVLLVINLTAMLWLAWALGLLSTGRP